MKENKLTILWTTGDPVTARKMVLMYALNSRLQGWWDDVTLVIWGASANLVAQNKDIQEQLKDVIDAGIKVEACKACADQLEVTSVLESLGVDVKYWGQPLTDVLKNDGKLLTI